MDKVKPPGVVRGSRPATGASEGLGVQRNFVKQYAAQVDFRTKYGDKPDPKPATSTTTFKPRGPKMGIQQHIQKLNKAEAVTGSASEKPVTNGGDIWKKQKSVAKFYIGDSNHNHASNHGNHNHTVAQNGGNHAEFCRPAPLVHTVVYQRQLPAPPPHTVSAERPAAPHTVTERPAVAAPPQSGFTRLKQRLSKRWKPALPRSSSVPAARNSFSPPRHHGGGTGGERGRTQHRGTTDTHTADSAASHAPRQSSESLGCRGDEPPPVITVTADQVKQQQQPSGKSASRFSLLTRTWRSQQHVGREEPAPAPQSSEQPPWEHNPLYEGGENAVHNPIYRSAQFTQYHEDPASGRRYVGTYLTSDVTSPTGFTQTSPSLRTHTLVTPSLSWGGSGGGGSLQELGAASLTPPASAPGSSALQRSASQHSALNKYSTLPATATGGAAAELRKKPPVPRWGWLRPGGGGDTGAGGGGHRRWFFHKSASMKSLGRLRCEPSGTCLPVICRSLINLIVRQKISSKFT